MIGQGWLWIGLAAMALGGLFSALSASIRDMSRAAMEDLVGARGNARIKARIDRILGDVEGHATAVTLPRIICNLLVAVAAVFGITGLFGVTAPRPTHVVLGILAASVLIWIFGLLIPQSVANHAAERTVYAWSPLIRGFYLGLGPLRQVVRFFDEVVRRLSGEEAGHATEALKAELMSVVEEGQEEGQFDEFERDMIKAVVGFRDTTVEQIMTPRTEVEALELTNNLGAITAFIRSSRHSRVPVFEGNLDNVAGMFYIKDLMHWLAGDGVRSGRPFELRTILRPAIFVPETKTIRELLAELMDKKLHVAMVADEYGGTSGLVTIEDIVEEIFGEIRDEYEIDEDKAPEVSVLVESKSAEIDARAYIDDANDALRAIGVELPEGEEYDTVGGMVVTSLGRIPEVGESLRVGSLLVTVLEAEATRVSRVRLEVAEEPAPGPQEAPADGANP